MRSSAQAIPGGSEAASPRAQLSGHPQPVEILSGPNMLGQVQIRLGQEILRVPRSRLVPLSEAAEKLLAAQDRFVVAAHAEERLAEHHPGADTAQVYAALEAGVELQRDMVNYLTGRRGRNLAPGLVPPDTYVLSEDRQGIFVIAGHLVVTYLRLGLAQAAFAQKHWPKEADEGEVRLAQTEPEPASQGESPKTELYHRIQDRHRAAVAPVLIYTHAPRPAERGGGYEARVRLGQDILGVGIGPRVKDATWRAAQERWVVPETPRIPGSAPSKEGR